MKMYGIYSDGIYKGEAVEWSDGATTARIAGKKGKHYQSLREAEKVLSEYGLSILPAASPASMHFERITAPSSQASEFDNPCIACLHDWKDHSYEKLCVKCSPHSRCQRFTVADVLKQKPDEVIHKFMIAGDYGFTLADAIIKYLTRVHEANNKANKE